MDRPEVRVPVAGSPLSRDGRLCMITIGIDPHKSSLTAVAVESTGEPVATMRLVVTATTVRQLGTPALATPPGTPLGPSLTVISSALIAGGTSAPTTSWSAHGHQSLGRCTQATRDPSISSRLRTQPRQGAVFQTDRPVV